MPLPSAAGRCRAVLGGEERRCRTRTGPDRAEQVLPSPPPDDPVFVLQTCTSSGSQFPPGSRRAWPSIFGTVRRSPDRPPDRPTAAAAAAARRLRTSADDPAAREGHRDGVAMAQGGGGGACTVHCGDRSWHVNGRQAVPFGKDTLAGWSAQSGVDIWGGRAEFASRTEPRRVKYVGNLRDYVRFFFVFVTDPSYDNGFHRAAEYLPC